MVKRLAVIGFAIAMLGIIGGIVQFAGPATPTAAVAVEAKDTEPKQWILPGFLREASGLAIASDNYLLTHNDETREVFRINTIDKMIDRLVAIGEPTEDEDFEGIALNGHTLYMTNSRGIVTLVDDLPFDEPDQTRPGHTIDTGLLEVCEIEGLHFLDGELLLPCKEPYTAEHQDAIVVFATNLENGKWRRLLHIPANKIPGLKSTKATAIDATEEHFYLIAQQQLLVISRADLSVELYKLPKKRHFQPEGIAVMPDGSIFIVDDSRRGRGTLTHYDGLAAMTAVKR